MLFQKLLTIDLNVFLIVFVTNQKHLMHIVEHKIQSNISSYVTWSINLLLLTLHYGIGSYKQRIHLLPFSYIWMYCVPYPAHLSWSCEDLGAVRLFVSVNVFPNVW